MTIITCPYCFEEFSDDKVHFRAPYAEPVDNSMLPLHTDIEDVIGDKHIDEETKKCILDEYKRKNQFIPRKDGKYESFWNRFGGTSESLVSLDGYPQYYRRVIDPSNADDRQLIEIQEQSTGDVFIRQNGIISEIQLKNGEFCTTRVCPHCHNPLPNQFGANEVKNIALIGIPGSGKTVYLSQFLKYLPNELAKVGGALAAYTDSLKVYIEKNNIAVGTPLPYPTPVQFLQQPIVCDFYINSKITNIVLRDVCGEFFSEYSTPEGIHNFAEYIFYSDAIILLIDPNNLDASIASIRAIHAALGDRIKSIPCAVCISKADKIYDSMIPREMVDILKSDYVGIPDENNPHRSMPVYNASQYTSYGEELAECIKSKNPKLDLLLREYFDSYAYFAVSALGCEIEEKDGNIYPVGPIKPTRLMDPFYWLMYKLGMLEADGGVYNPNNPA